MSSPSSRVPLEHARRDAGRTWLVFVAVLALVAAVASVEFYALVSRGRSEPPAPPVAADRVVPAPPLGSIDVPAQDAITSPHVAVSGWALAQGGVRAIELRVDGRVFAARYGLPRADVASVHPGYPDSAAAGFAFDGEVILPPAPGVDRRSLNIVAIARDGREAVIGTKDLIDSAALARFADLPRAATPPFYLLPASSAIAQGGATGLETSYRAYTSRTVTTGMRVPILYLRTTRGKAQDYAFDPEWDTERRCGSRRIAEDSLGSTLRYAALHRIPVLFTLNGGIWADAACDVPEWDVNDHLEQDLANCQWNEKNEVMPDDYLRTLPGSQDAPELARSLTFNVYARAVRHYKRRNLQAAGTVVAAFAREHPDLFVGVNLDPDVYLNPFFGEAQWYDYNPGTLRQFREWLSGTGPYAGRPRDGAPDLTRYRRKRPLSLAAVNRLAGRQFARWEDVDPPRAFPKEAAGGRPPYWDDAWTREWETFRRHLVDLHYDELSQWLNAVGVPSARIWSSQGFMAPHADARPFAMRIDSAMKNYDTGGMTLEGAIPAHGHLGAILYGASAVNDIRMETPASLFDNFRTLDPGWAAVEINTADLRQPAEQPTYAAGYRALRDLFNYGARFVSPMAWNGSNGTEAGKPGYVTFTAWRNTPFEQAARDFMLSHANVPLGARLWTFGTPRHADVDGWTAEQGTIVPHPGALDLMPDRNAVTLVSPAEIAAKPADFSFVVIGLEDAASLAGVRVSMRERPQTPWRVVAVAENAVQRTSGGIAVAVSVPRERTRFDRMRIELRFAAGATMRLTRVALWPRGPDR